MQSQHLVLQPIRRQRWRFMKIMSIITIHTLTRQTFKTPTFQELEEKVQNKISPLKWVWWQMHKMMKVKLHRINTNNQSCNMNRWPSPNRILTAPYSSILSYSQHQLPTIKNIPNKIKMASNKIPTSSRNSTIILRSRRRSHTKKGRNSIRQTRTWSWCCSRFKACTPSLAKWRRAAPPFLSNRIWSRRSNRWVRRTARKEPSKLNRATNVLGVMCHSFQTISKQ